MVWSLFLPRGSYVIELQQDADKTAHFVGCYKADISLASKGVIGIPSPWDPPTNLYSEWGAWAFRNKINFACVSNLVVACWYLFFWQLLCHTVGSFCSSLNCFSEGLQIFIPFGAIVKSS